MAAFVSAGTLDILSNPARHRMELFLHLYTSGSSDQLVLPV